MKLECPTGCPPRLRITAHELGELSETIHHSAGQAPEDAGHYAWAWGEFLSSVLEPGDAATEVLRVLAARERRA